MHQWTALFTASSKWPLRVSGTVTAGTVGALFFAVRPFAPADARANRRDLGVRIVRTKLNALDINVL